MLNCFPSSFPHYSRHSHLFGSPHHLHPRHPSLLLLPVVLVVLSLGLGLILLIVFIELIIGCRGAHGCAAFPMLNEYLLNMLSIKYG